jgi:TatD DNase family protein
MRLYDAHNHVHDERLCSALDDILSECEARGVSCAVVNGSSERDWDDVLALARSRPWVIPSFGYHPWYIADATPAWRDTLVRYLDAVPAAIGEIGLDRWKHGLDPALQEEFFLAQLEIAAERNLPVSIHCLKAWGRLVELLSTHKRPRCGFLLHSYGGSAELVPQLTKLGAYFSCPGYFLGTEKRSKVEVFRAVPRDRLLIETDAPDQCLPESLDRYHLRDEAGRRINHPALLGSVYQGVADVLGLSLPELAACVGDNFERLFSGVRRF